MQSPALFHAHVCVVPSDRFWTSLAPVRQDLRTRRHSGGSRAIKEPPNWGSRRLSTELYWDLQQRAVRGGGGHVDRTPASPRQPLCTSRFGWVPVISARVCVRVDVQMQARNVLPCSLGLVYIEASFGYLLQVPEKGLCLPHFHRLALLAN